MSEDLLYCISYLRNNSEHYNVIQKIGDFIISNNLYTNIDFWDNYIYALTKLGLNDKAYNYMQLILGNKICKINNSDANKLLEIIKYISTCYRRIIIPHSIFMLINNDNISNVNIESFDKKLSEYKIDGFNCFNPSIVKSNNGYIMNIRMSNYNMDNNYKYLPINESYKTFNKLMYLDNNLNILSTKLVEYKKMPYQAHFEGWEDVRLFYYKNKLHCSFTSLEATENKRQKICMSNLEDELPEHILLNGFGDDHVQKNWSPCVVENNLYFIYYFYPLIVLKYNEEIKNVILHQISLPDVQNYWRGGSPLLSLKSIGYPNNYICIIHEAHFPDYVQRFVLIEVVNNIFTIINSSSQFYFLDSRIEFCAGLEFSSDNTEFIATFGKLDRSVFISKIKVEPIIKSLLNIKIINKISIPNTKLNSPYTFVSCYFNLNKLENREAKKNHDTYLANAIKLFSKDVKFVFYTDDDDMIESISKIRANCYNNIHIVKISLSQISYYKYLDKIQNIRNSTQYGGLNKEKDTPLYTIIMYSKFFFLNHAIHNNYLNTQYFAWIDAGIEHIATTNNYINSFNKPSEKVSILCMNTPVLEKLEIQTLNKFCYRMACGFFGGNAHYIMEFVKAFDETLELVLNSNIAPLEEGVIALVCAKYPDLFEFYYGDFSNIIDNFAFMSSTNNIHIIFHNIWVDIQNKRYKQAKHAFEYIMKSYISGIIKLNDNQYRELMEQKNILFFKN